TAHVIGFGSDVGRTVDAVGRTVADSSDMSGEGQSRRGAAGPVSQAFIRVQDSLNATNEKLQGVWDELLKTQIGIGHSWIDLASTQLKSTMAEVACISDPRAAATPTVALLKTRAAIGVLLARAERLTLV